MDVSRDDIMNAARRRRRVARSRKDCGDAKHLTIASINAVDDEQVGGQNERKRALLSVIWQRKARPACMEGDACIF
jgi:hypothetical protein